MRARYEYSREEEILIIDLYTRIPTSMIRDSNADIIKLCQVLNSYGYGCVVSGIRNKMENLKSVDDEYTSDGRLGRSKIRKSFKELWDEFQKDGFSTLDAAVEQAWRNVESHMPGTPIPSGRVPSREGQSLFRQRVLKNYDCACCISGMKEVSLLEACHIMPYSVCMEMGLSSSAMDIRNGLCMNTLYHKAFDKGLFTIDADHRVELSKHLDTEFSAGCVDSFFAPFDGKVIADGTLSRIGDRYLEYHRRNTFRR